VTLAIEVIELHHNYGSRPSLRGVSFDVRAGEILALVGPNGAGKTTTIRAVCTLTHPGYGLVDVGGYDTVLQPYAVRRSIGVVFQDHTLDADLSVEANLRFHAALHGMPASEAKRRAAELLSQLGIADRRKTTVRELSGGLKRRAEIARALLHRPSILVLDEPTIGLDPHARHNLWLTLRALRDTEGVTVFFTTHYIDEAEVADRVVIIDDGRVICTGSPGELKAQLAVGQVQVATTDPTGALNQLRDAGFAASRTGDSITVETADPDTAIPLVIAALRVPVRSVAVRQPSLEDLFRQVTRDNGSAVPVATSAQEHTMTAGSR
jgi:ABC-2 type transport system ATP-binding protein